MWDKGRIYPSSIATAKQYMIPEHGILGVFEIENSRTNAILIFHPSVPKMVKDGVFNLSTDKGSLT